ncbi:MAG: DUF4251 domain-containing protein [Bacteroidales bacterium]|nr:DUF4251 domain-containing protein [Bacteroidales bacterium]
MKKFIVMMLALFLAASPVISESYAQEQKVKLTRAEKKALKEKKKAEEKARLENALKTCNYKIVINRIYPFGMNAITTNDGYYIKIENGVLDMHVPYMGSSKSAAWGEQRQGIDVEAQKITITSQYYDKNESWIYQFNFINDNRKDNNTCTIEIYDNGNANIRVESNGRDAIQYSGEIRFE